jgi:methionine-rich copper-binding protein CopC
VIRRHVRGAAVASAACLVALAVSAPAALGHAAFLDSTPPPGARLEEAPRVLTLQ